MVIQNDFLEFLNQPRCKTAMLCITIVVFFTLMITEAINRPSEFVRQLSAMAFTFWAGRASKQSEKNGKAFKK